MRIIAYLYSDPLLEPTPDRTLWGWEVDQVYQDIATEKATRPQLQQLVMDCQTEPAEYLLVRRLINLKFQKNISVYLFLKSTNI